MDRKSIKVMLVEDYKLMRVGLKSLLEKYADLDIVAEAETAQEAINKVKNIPIDVVLLDIGLPDMNGIQLAKKLLDIRELIKIVILTSHLSKDEVKDSLVAGVNAYALKDIGTETLAMVIKTVRDGAMWLDPQIVPYVREENACCIPTKQISKTKFKETHSNLTQREYEVLKLLVDGKSNNDIAKILTISEHTAKAHVCNIIQKLVVDDRTQAAVKALKEGLV